MDMHDYWRILRHRWLSIAIITAVCVGLAAAYTLLSPRVYKSTAQNFVALAGATTNASSSAALGLQRVKSYVELVDTPEVLAPVIAELGLDMTVPQLAGEVSAANPPQTVLLDVSVVNGAPKQALEIANATAVSLAKRIEALETPAGSSSPAVKVTVTNPAQGAALVSPNATINLALGLILGLGLGIAYAILRDQLDTSVKSETELSELTGRTNLGAVMFDPEAETTPLVTLNPASVRSEGFRTVRTNLQYVDVDNPPKTVVITSALPNEGKTTTACNLAIVLAQAGRSVCLVEADLRKPKVADYLGIDGGTGLVDVLTGQLELDAAIVSWQRGLLSVIPSGPIPPIRPRFSAANRWRMCWRSSPPASMRSLSMRRRCSRSPTRPCWPEAQTEPSW